MNAHRNTLAHVIAHDAAVSDIECFCRPRHLDAKAIWYDITDYLDRDASIVRDVDRSVAYLETCGRLEHHPDNANLVRFRALNFVLTSGDANWSEHLGNERRFFPLNNAPHKGVEPDFLGTFPFDKAAYEFRPPYLPAIANGVGITHLQVAADVAAVRYPSSHTQEPS